MHLRYNIISHFSRFFSVFPYVVLKIYTCNFHTYNSMRVHLSPQLPVERPPCLHMSGMCRCCQYAPRVRAVIHCRLAFTEKQRTTEAELPRKSIFQFSQLWVHGAGDYFPGSSLEQLRNSILHGGITQNDMCRGLRRKGTHSCCILRPGLTSLSM